jgi:alcohol dehydrogenase class IV
VKNINFLNSTKVKFGAGRINELGDTVCEYGTRCMLVTVPIFEAQRQLFEKAKSLLAEKDVLVFHYDKAVPNPTTDTINAGIAEAKKNNVNVVLGIGGGSSMDTAKAIALGARNDGDIWDYRVIEGKSFKNKGLPVVLVPTTSGTGAHVAPAAVLTNNELKYKSAICDPEQFPVVGIVDPELMLTLPPSITAFTGFDNFTHLFEGYININSNEFIETLALDGMRRVIKYLPRAVENRQDIEARSQIAWADTLAGYCINNCGVTLPHGIGMAISGRFPNISHGEALAIIYPPCMSFTWEAAKEKFAQLACIFDPQNAELNVEEAAYNSVQEIIEFLLKTGAYSKLGKYGVTEKDIEILARDTFKLPDYKANPRVPNEEEVYNILIQAL